MTLAWMAYCLLVSLLLGLAALAAERGLRLYQRPVRWFWLGAIAGSFVLPALTYLLPAARPLSSEPLLPVVEAIVGVEVMATRAWDPGGGAGQLLTMINDALLVLWVLTSVALLAFYTRSYFRLRNESRRWSPSALGKNEVLVSTRLGPAVTGLFRSWIVMPAWTLELDEEFRRMILLHEEEHLRAGDHRLLLFGLVALTAMPWNLPLWWQFRRLRLALELDCDRRVIERGVSPRVYGELLLEVGRRSASPGFLPASFSEPRSLLEERVCNMIAKVPKDRRQRATVAATLAAGLLSLAFAAPSPSRTAEAPSAPTLDLPTLPDAAAPQDSSRPHFTPYTVRPDLKDRRAAVAAVQRHYPDSLKAAGIGGTAVVWVFIDEEGVVRNAKLHESSGNDALDEAALAAARELEFTPALNEDEVVAVWVAIPITFSVESGKPSEETPEQDLPTAPEAAPQDTSRPQFTPYTTRPQLKNRQAAVAAIERHYPNSLKAAGIGGTVKIWVLIDEEGVVRNAKLYESAGNDALDEAALAAAREFEFAAALKDDECVAVWVAIPITFSAKPRDTPK